MKDLVSHQLVKCLNKVSLVIGAPRGIGRSMAFGVAEAGSDLMLLDVLDDRIIQT